MYVWNYAPKGDCQAIKLDAKKLSEESEEEMVEAKENDIPNAYIRKQNNVIDNLPPLLSCGPSSKNLVYYVKNQ